MRKTLIIIFALAVLGGMTFYVNKSKSNSQSQVTSNTQQATNSNTGSRGSSAASNSKNYKEGTFTGSVADTPYGTVQIAVVVSSGKISDVKFLQMPFEEMRSKQISMMAEPQLKQNALDAQSSQIDFVTGATSTSYGYQESLQKALDQAKVS
jgi:uncharacterized protein with FMN-binding domain